MRGLCRTLAPGASCTWRIVYGKFMGLLSINPALLVFFAGNDASIALNSFCYWLFWLRKSDTVFNFLYNRFHVIDADRTLLLLCHGCCFVVDCILLKGKEGSLYNRTSHDRSGFLYPRCVLISAKSSRQSSRHIRCPFH